MVDHGTVSAKKLELAASGDFWGAAVSEAHVEEVRESDGDPGSQGATEGADGVDLFFSRREKEKRARS
jgi:hypothetical protein